MQIYNARRRKAISPVLATVILIAITLIAAIAIAGFVFGLFGSFTSSARVQVVSTSFAHAAASPWLTGSVTVQNIGTSNANANSITVTYGGQTCAPGMGATAVPATGAQTPLTLTGAGTCTIASLAGEAFSGSVQMSNGAQVPFTGVFS